jgi:hypothetical protein
MPGGHKRALRDLSSSRIEGQDQFLDLRVDLVCQDDKGKLHDDAETILTVGGVWDRQKKRYTAIADQFRRLGLHPGQTEAARWISRWFEAKRAGEKMLDRGKPVYSVLLHGGRRAGKTDLGVKAGVAYAVARARSWVWLVSENQAKTEELDQEVERLLPNHWYAYRAAPWYQYVLANGSIIWLRSAHKPLALKRGRVDFAVLNEAQNMSETAFAIVRAATADNGGLTLLAANPPENPIGFWVERFMEEARAGKRQAREFGLDSTRNPHIDHESLEAMRAEVDDRTFRREILGEFLPRTDVVFHAWSNSAAGNVRPPPELANADVTRAFTKRHLGREFTCILGMDFQRVPYPCAVEMRLFRDPESDLEPLIWLTRYVVAEDGDEAALSEALLAVGYDPMLTAIVADASGAYQGIDRTKKIGSHEILQGLGWKWIYKPDKDMDKNPLIMERCRATNTLMKSASGKRRLFSDPANLGLNEAIKNWENRQGAPYRRSVYAHLCDAATYPVWRFWPHRGRKVRQAPPAAGTMIAIDPPPKGPRII